jgi:hypothetical protein
MAKKQTKTTEYDGSTPLSNVRWEHVVAGIVLQNLSASQAYKEAGYKTNRLNDDAIRANSSRLIAKDNVRKRKQYLERQLQRQNIDKRERFLAILEGIAENTEMPPREITAAIKEYAAISGWHIQTIKHETDSRQAELDEAEKAEIRRLALLRFSPHLLPPQPIIDVTAEPTEPEGLSGSADETEQGDILEDVA